MDDAETGDARAAFARWAEGNPHASDAELAFLAGWQISGEPVGYPGITREPHDRLTRLCEVAATAIRNDRDGGPAVKLIIMAEDGNMAGIEVRGYRNSAESIADLLYHLKELLRAHGIELDLTWPVKLPADGEDLARLPATLRPRKPARPAGLPPGLSGGLPAALRRRE